MTTGNKRTCAVSLTLAFVLLFVSILSGCNANSTSAFSAVGKMLSDADTESVMECEVVYPTDSSAKVVMAARELADLLEMQTEMSVTSHRYEGRYASEKIYVVIGRVNDDVTEYWYDEMAEGDYICRVYGNTVALGGITEGATLEAIQRFTDEILPMAEYGYIANEGVLFEFNATDDEDAVILNGYRLDEYDIVFTDISLSELASDFGEEIEKINDYTLNVFLRDPQQSEKEIVVKVNKNFSPQKYRISCYGDDIIVESDSIYGLSLALEGLLNKLSDEVSKGINELEITGEESFSYPNTQLTAAAYRLDRDMEIDNDSLEAVLLAIQQSKADIITVRVSDKYKWSILEMYLYEDYDVRSLECDDGGVIAILSRPKMTVLEDALIKTEGGVTVVKIAVTCIDKKYDVFSLYPSEEYGANNCLQIIERCFEASDAPSVCMIVPDENDVSAIVISDTNDYLCAVNSIVSSGTAKYRMCVLVSRYLDCYENTIFTENEGRYVGACVSVRNGYRPYL